MLMSEIGRLYDANERWKNELQDELEAKMESWKEELKGHFDFTVETIRHDLDRRLRGFRGEERSLGGHARMVPAQSPPRVNGP